MRTLATLIALLVVAASAQAQNLGRGLMINEVYIGTSANTDQYIEIYNPQTTTQYLDGCMIVQFDTTGGKLSGTALTGAVRGWKFPGTAGGKTLPVNSKQFVVVAASASKHTGGLDLSGSAYEAHASMAQGNTNAKQLTNMSPAMTYPGLTPSITGDAIVLTNGSDATITDGVNVSSILDAVQYGSTIQQGNFPLSIDTMRTGGQYLKPGFSIERNQAGVSTHNSYADFSLQYPTPGTEHLTQQQQTVTPALLFPFDLNRFVALNQFDTSSSSVTQFGSSQTIISTGLTFQGASNVALMRDSSLIGSGGAVVNDIHLKTTSAGDLQAWGDKALIDYAIASSIDSIFTPPNTWIDYIKMSSGIGVSYPVTTLTGQITSPATATVSITMTGMYKGIERRTVAEGTFDSAYRFDLTALVNISSSGFTLGSFKIVRSVWLVNGIGIIAQGGPQSGTTILGNNIPVDGTFKTMIAHGIRSLSAVAQSARDHNTTIFPNPAAMVVHVAGSKSVKSMTLFDIRGDIALYREILRSEETPAIDIQNVPAGSYMAKFEFLDGTIELWPLAIRR